MLQIQSTKKIINFFLADYQWILPAAATVAAKKNTLKT